MPLDHYVSQVHLKKFCSSESGRLFAIRKSDFKAFSPRTQDICRLPDGNTNPFLKEARVIEDFLKLVEPNYNTAVENLLHQRIDHGTVNTIAGFAAYVASCAPAAMRIEASPIKDVINATGRILDEKGRLPPPPPILGARSFSELADSGAIDFSVDPKYPQAMGIAGIRRQVMGFANFEWDILLNEINQSPFFTSDFPVAFEHTAHPRILNRIVPLTPNLAIRIKPSPRFFRKKELFDPALSHFRARWRKASRSEVLELNKLIVRCAENEVYYCEDLPWIKPFISKNRYFRIESVTERKRTARGYELFFTKKFAQIKPTI